MVLASLVMALFYIGGELAQSRLGLPSALTGVYQGLLLFFLLACDTLVHYRVQLVSRRSRLMDELASLIALTMNAGTPLLLAALGVLINERSGVVNLGTEGMMLVAAVSAFATTLLTGHYWIGFLVGAALGRADGAAVCCARCLDC